MSKQRHILPTQKAIRNYWVPKLGGTKAFADVVHRNDDDICFACSYPFHKCERAHIKARSVGGPDTVENLHMLCPACHKNSEYLEGDKYWAWFESRTLTDMLMFTALKHGMNVTDLMKKSK